MLHKYSENKEMDEWVYQRTTVTVMLHDKPPQNSEAYNKNLLLLSHIRYNPDTWVLPPFNWSGMQPWHLDPLPPQLPRRLLCAAMFENLYFR